jgi:molybdopterin-guanine dinucleotide biosynthesis protein A
MGQDKAWLEIEGRPMIERVIAAARPVVERLGIVINASNPQAERYERLTGSWNAELLFDLHEHCGPLGGIHTALADCAENESALILACDLPFITTEFLSFLSNLHQSGERQAVTVPLDQSNRLQPLAAIFSQSCQTAVEQMLAADDLKVDLLYSRLPVRRVRFAEFAHLPNAERFFVNVNTPIEYRSAINFATTPEPRYG